MKLHHSPSSPYVRKVMALAIETGLDRKLEMLSLAVSPINPNDDLNRSNPLGKIPALVLEDGTTLYDSRVICEYLDSLHDGHKLFPVQDPARWTALRRQALADGVLDAAVSLRYETFLRPEAQRWGDWIDGQRQKILRALDQLEAETDSFADGVDIGTLSVGCALGYLDFRFADLGWRESRPGLAGWYQMFSHRPSLAGTTPA